MNNKTTSVFEKANNVRRHVNEFDKAFSINLNVPNDLNEPAQIIDFMTEQFQNYLIDVIYYINRIKINNELSLEKKIKFIETDEFLNSSRLDYFEYMYPQDTYTFKLRFLTFFIRLTINRIEKLYNNRYYILNNEPAKYEQIYFELSKIINDFIKFIDIFESNGQAYKNIILQINHHCSFITSRKTDPIDINNHIRNITDELEVGIPTSNSSIVMPEDIAIDSILKLSYMITTGKTNLDVLPKFKYIKNATTQYDLGVLIESLGCAIDLSTKKNKNSTLFRCYCKSLPLVYTKRNFGDNEELIIGMYALAYCKFFCNNPMIDKYIDQMMESIDRK
jgi:hypothetical protein